MEWDSVPDDNPRRGNMRSRIIGTGSFVPERVLSNSDLERIIDTSDAWIRERTGIRERRIASETETTSFLAEGAARAALDVAGISISDINIIIVATSTPEMFSPSTACLVQNRIGAKGATGFDISAACSGFIFALSVADQFIRNRSAETILVIGSEVMSRIVDWTDRTTCILFGDGAGAVVLRGEEGNRGVLSTHLCSDGNLWDLIRVPGGGSRRPFQADPGSKPEEALKMRGSETFKVAVRSLEDVAMTALSTNALNVKDISLLIPHQANLRIIRGVAARLGIMPDRVMINLDRFGNTSAASIPLALDEAARKGKINPSDIVLLVAFGGGLTWGAAVVRW
jgi:3-oxoacyl-[acyl-carrier-protein] synthase III